MLDAALVGLGWWGKNILKAVQGRSGKIRFVHGVSKELDDAKPLAEQHAGAGDDVGLGLGGLAVDQQDLVAVGEQLAGDGAADLAGAGDGDAHQWASGPSAKTAASSSRR